MGSTTEALLIVAVALMVIYVSRKIFTKRDNLNLPPGPTPLPIIGSLLHLLGALPHQSLASLAQKYGPVMSVRLGQRLYIVATSSEAATVFLKHQDANFSSRPTLRCVQILMPKDLSLHDLTPVTRHLRKILVTALTGTKQLEASKYIRAEEVADMLRSIARETGPFRLATYVDTMSTNILSRMILSKRFLGGEDQNRVSAVQEFIEIADELPLCLGAMDPQDYFNFIPEWFDPQGLGTRFRKLRGRMNLFYTNMVKQHKEDRSKNPVSEEEKTLLDVLLEQLDIPEHEVTEEHLKGLFWDAFIAGTHTSAVTIEWAMAEMLRNPTLATQARSELDRVVGLHRTVQESDLPDLKFLHAIVKETLRLHTPVPFLLPHQSLNATTALGYHIPAQTILFVNVWAMGRDPRVWEKPLEFVPARFGEGAAHGSTEFHGQHYEYIPFGAGRRQCPGLALGSVAVHLNLASVLHAFEWSLPDGMAPEKLDMTESGGVTTRLRDSLVVVAKPRLPTHLY